MGKIVRIDKTCLVTAVLTPVVESYPRETQGYLFGDSHDNGNVSISLGYPEITAVRKRRSVDHDDDDEGWMRAVEYLCHSAGVLRGGYHSHPEMGYTLSKGDRKSIPANMELMRDRGLFGYQDWLELLVTIDRCSRQGRLRLPSLWKSGRRLKATFYRDGEMYRMQVGGFEVSQEGESHEIDLNIDI